MTGKLRSSIEEEAVSWFVLLRDDAATRADHTRFEAWLQADPRHRAVWRDVAGTWAAMDRLQPRRVRPRQGWRRSARFAAAAVLVLAAVLGSSVMAPEFAIGLLADYRTGSAQVEKIAQSDGSTIELDASSALSVLQDGETRGAVLYRGEAYFSVSRDPARPYVVKAAGGRITVVGTAFNVKLVGDHVSVAVASGSVEVTAGGESVRLIAGQMVAYGDEGVRPVRPVDLADVGAWRGGRLVFRGVPLAEVLRELERYHPGRIVITDTSAAELAVTGVFATARPEAALETIAHTLPVRITYLGDVLVLVASRQ